MMFAFSSLVRQKEDAQGKEEEGWEVEESQELRRQARMLPYSQLGQWRRLRETGENMDGGVGF